MKYLVTLLLLTSIPLAAERLSELKLIAKTSISTPTRLVLCDSELWVYSRNQNALYRVNPGTLSNYERLKPNWLKSDLRVTALGCAQKRLIVGLQNRHNSHLYRLKKFQSDTINNSTQTKLKIENSYRIPGKRRVDSISCRQSCQLLLSGKPYQLTLKSGRFTPVELPESRDIPEASLDLERNPFGNWQDKLELSHGRYTVVKVLPDGVAYLDGLKNVIVSRSGESEFIRFGRWGVWEGYLLGPRNFIRFENGDWLVVDSFLRSLFLFSEAGQFIGSGAINKERLKLSYPIDITHEGDRIWLIDFQLETLFAFQREVADSDSVSVEDNRLRTNLLRLNPQLSSHHSCLRCHDGTVHDDLDRFIPEPTGHDGHCSYCHEHHHTGTPPFLKERNTRQLCLECHDSHEKTAGNHPLLKDHCLTCHELHGQRDKHLKTDTVSKLCLRCHPNHRIKHRNIKPLLKGSRAANLRLENSDIYCLTCHQVHYSESKKGLLHSTQETKDFCARCHRSRIENYYNNIHLQNSRRSSK